MKKNFKFMLVALLAFVGFNSASAAIVVGDALSDDNYYYEVKTVAVSGTTGTGTVYITKFNSAPAAAVVLPNQYVKVDAGVTYTFKVTGIKDQTFANAAFKDQTQITSVKVPSSFEYIGENAFAGCTNLATIDLTEATGLKNIGDQAFITIQVTSYDFSACTKLVGLTGEPFVQTGKDANSFIESITLPTSSSFKFIGTALSKLPKLATQNIASTKIQEIVAEAFKGDAEITSLTLPGSVKYIRDNAFKGSKIATLVIDATSIQTIGDGAAVYGTDAGTVLTSLTINNELKGVIKTKAFAGEGKMETLALNCTFGTTGQIETEAFKGIDKIESLTLGAIKDNGKGDYTIKTKAFSGAKLKTLTIGEITTALAIEGNAFDDGTTPTITTVTIGNIKAGGEAIDAKAFVFADATCNLTIGNVRSTNATDPVMAASAFDFSKVNDATSKTVTVKIGAVEAKGKNFSGGDIVVPTACKKLTLEFTGDIEQTGLDVAILSNNGKLNELTFGGKVAEGGICADAFAGLANNAVVEFKGSLAELAVMEDAFTVTPGNKLTVKYTGTPDDDTVIPFDQDAFINGAGTQPLAADADRFVTLTITDTYLKTLIASQQVSIDAPEVGQDPDDDIIYGVILINTTEPEALALTVYQQTGTTTSYGRWYFDAAKYPNGLIISRRGNDGVKTLSLYTTYIEDDADNEVVNINMQPIVSTDGKYYFKAADLAAGLVVLAKATGTSADETDILYVENIAGEPSSIWYTDNEVKISASVTTNEQLRDGSGDVVVADDEDIYFINNPANHKGMSAKTYDFRNATNIYVDNGSFYLLASHYDNGGAARIIWHDGEESATAIMATKKANVEGGVIYNLAGQKVDASYKGIVIMNGKKFIQK